MIFSSHDGLTTGTRSMIAVCYGYRIKLYRSNIIRDMVMQLNFTYLPKTGQHLKHMVVSQTSWLVFIIRVYNVFDPVCKFFEIYAFTWKLTDISLFCCVSRFGEINDHS